jgi:4-amino-4-deoxy-L-arabinose transferase-like glycosyltransferase
MNIGNYDAPTKLRIAILAILNMLLRYKFETAFLIIIVAGSFVFFFRLDSPSILMWDESRQAINALEMATNHSYIVTYYDGEPDLFNTKPPLLIWFITVFMKVLGYNEVAVRLPSAISAMITVIILFLFCAKRLDDLKAGIFSSFILISSVGFIGEHVARTGDYDAMLVLWIVVFCFSYFAYLHADTARRQHLYLTLTTTALVLAILTKGIAGLMCLPGVVLYTAWQKKLKSLLISPAFYLAAAVFLVITLGYYLLRDYQNPGYIQAVINNELTGRYLNDLETHYAEFWYYLKDILRFKFIPWIYVLPLCFVATQPSSNKKIVNRIGIYATLFLVCDLLVISFSQTKLPWYDAPFYPMASLLVGLGISSTFDAVLNFNRMYNRHIRLCILGLLFACTFSIPYLSVAYSTIYKNHGIIYGWSRPSNPQLKYGEYIKQLEIIHPEIKSYYVVNDDYNSHLLFYVKVANLKDRSIKIISSDQVSHTATPLVTCDPTVKKQLEQRYNMSLIHSNHPCYTFHVKFF